MNRQSQQAFTSCSRMAVRCAAWALVVTVPFVLPPAGQAKTLTSFDDSAGQHVFYTGWDQHIHQLYWNPNNGWVNQDLTIDSGATNSALWGGPVASFNDSLGEHVFYLCANGNNWDVCQLFFNGGWVNQDLTQIAGGLPTDGNTDYGSLTAFNDGYGEHVFYVAFSNAHLYQLYTELRGHWINQDLTVMSGANNVARSPVASFGDSAGEHAFYTGSNGHTYQLYFNGNDWAVQDLTAIARTGVRNSGTVRSGLSDFYGEHSFYVGTNQHMNQLVFHNGLWRNQDLTTNSGATIFPQPDGAMTSFNDSSGTHTFFVGTDQHIYELFTRSKVISLWGNLDLTAASGANALADVACGSQITGFNNRVETRVLCGD